MPACVSDMIELMEQIAPTHLAEEWDNVGLQVGDRRWTVRRIGVALDAGLEVIDSACEFKVDMLITHHPLIFSPLRTIDCHTPVGAIIQKAIEHRIAIYAAHTNFDKSEEGLNDILARRIGLLECTALESSVPPDGSQTEAKPQGIGRIGNLPEAVQLKDFAVDIKKRLNLDSIKIVGRPNLQITRAAVCTGSGSSLVDVFLKSGAQVYISGDLRFHDARDVEAANLGMIDIGHFPSEYLMVDDLVERLKQMVSHNRLKVSVQSCGTESDPFVTL
ncbi:MAG: Nif3-like dinuclear metal center hexameric protein [Deltaproteobacteria bacterium]|nr:Nif3-like dinuclear metal center hexameric protein [Deltaproteobacteria bacterium]